MFASIQHANGSWTVLVDGDTYTFNRSHDHYDALVECIDDQDGPNFLLTFNQQKDELEGWCKDGFRYNSGDIMYHDRVVNDAITERILEMIRRGISNIPLLNFLKRLYDNPEERAINELYEFLQHKHMPITHDGYILGYKYVDVYHGADRVDANGNTLTKGDYVDSHTGRTHRYNVGDVAHMPRVSVDNNMNEGCSAGLHVGAYSYAGHHPHVVLVKVDPADVVSIPSDCSFQKMRCCRFEVVKDLSDQEKKSYDASVVHGDSYVDEDYDPFAAEEEYDYEECDYCGGDIEDCGGCDEYYEDVSDEYDEEEDDNIPF